MTRRFREILSRLVVPYYLLSTRFRAILYWKYKGYRNGCVMSFSGKRFRRVRCENIDELMREANASEHTIQMMKSSAPIFSFTRVDENTFTFNLEMENKTMTNTFKLGEEHEQERRDGSKVKVTYTLESDNVLKQVIRQPDGKLAYFRREFGDKETKMIITMGNSDKEARIYYEVVE